VSEIAVNAALAMIENEQPRGETECAIAIQMACVYSATITVLGPLGGGHGGDRHLFGGSDGGSFSILVETLRRLRSGVDRKSFELNGLLDNRRFTVELWLSDVYRDVQDTSALFDRSHRARGRGYDAASAFRGRAGDRAD
jgi:hypothetical protein